MRLTRDLTHSYHGYLGCPSRCWLRIYEEPGRTPVVIASELEDNPGTSVTNAVERIAADVLRLYLRDRLGKAVPFFWYEHYAYRHRWIPPGLDFDQVTFASYTPRPRGQAGLSWEELGEPTWTPACRADLEAIVGAPISDRPRVAEGRA